MLLRLALDKSFLENGLVGFVNGKFILTGLGLCYGMAAYKDIKLIKKNVVLSLELYKNVEVIDIPDTLIINDTLTKDGFIWIVKYFSMTSVNEYLLNEAQILLKLYKVELVW